MERTQRNLTEAAQVGNIEALYASIQSIPKILDEIDEIPFVNTPLHEAAAAGKTHFALEILSLKPSFGRKLNPDGLSPLHLALQNKRDETVERLIEFDSELIRVKGREQLTPLHYVAAEKGNATLLAEFLCACPGSINDLTIRKETAIHIAAKMQNVEGCKVILNWLIRSHSIEVPITWKDEDGNTALHIAVTNNQPEIVRWLVTKKPVLIYPKNLENLTALDIASGLYGDDDEIMKILRRAKASKASSLLQDTSIADFLVSPQKITERLFGFGLQCRKELSPEMSNTVLVVAVLIATGTFQAVLSPPGGISKQDSNGDTTTSTTSLAALHGATWAYHSIFIGFYLCNTAAFAASIAVITWVLEWQPFSFVLHVSLVFIAISYGLAIFSHSPSHGVAWTMLVASLAVPFVCYCSKMGFWFAEREIKLEGAEIWRGVPLPYLKLPYDSTRRLRIVSRLVG